VDRLNAAAVKVLAMKDVQEKVIAGGSEPVTSTPEQFAERIRNDVVKFQKLAQAAGIKPQ
jgi:tripartite-type tricarboxylate transporter receptor subunit TctC